MKDMKSRLPAPKTPSPTTTKTGFDLAKKGVNLAAGFDMFDVVKGYLIGEGYADTEEAALAIMINMSEEWRQSIIVEAQVANRNPDEYERKAKQGQSREQQLKGRVMGKMSQMDPEKRKKMLAQMRAVGLDV
jgi:formate dehydrogenase assembly factor FdhD